MAGAPPVVSSLLRFVRRHRLVPPGSRVVAAVSGGPDSSCLLHALCEARGALGVELEVAHVDHGLRKRAAARDAAFVEGTAARLGLRFHLGRVALPAAGSRRGRSLQELAREARLGHLLGLARRRRAIVALGHSLDDQAETVLMRLLGCAGPAALAGIPPASHAGRVVHPLLGVRRAAIEAWLAARGIPFRTDRTNRSLRFARNRIRLRLLPVLLSDFNPRLVERLGTIAELLRRDGDLLERQAAAVLERVVPARGAVVFPAELLEREHPALLSRAVLAALRRLSRRPEQIASRHVEALVAGGRGARRWDLPGAVRASADAAGLRLEAGGGRPARRPARRRLPIPGEAALPGAGTVRASLRPRPRGFDPRAFSTPARVVLDADRVRPPLTVRGRRPGDRIRPLGLSGTKKVKELLLEAGIPAGERDLVPLVCDAGGIVWVAGVRVAEPCRVGPRTRRLLVLEWTGAGGRQTDLSRARSSGPPPARGAGSRG